MHVDQLSYTQLARHYPQVLVVTPPQKGPGSNEFEKFWVTVKQGEEPLGAFTVFMTVTHQGGLV